MNITQTHINTLQGIINRHANYSLNCKTWCITIIAAMSVLLYEERQNINIIIPIFPIIIFYLLDCFYLGLERLFKDIYNEFIQNLQTDSKISKDIIINTNGRCKINYFFKGFISFSTTPIYLIISIYIYFIFKGI